MADALRIANGFLPVKDDAPPDDPTKFEFPLVLVELEIALLAKVPPPCLPPAPLS